MVRDVIRTFPEKVKKPPVWKPPSLPSFKFCANCFAIQLQFGDSNANLTRIKVANHSFQAIRANHANVSRSETWVPKRGGLEAAGKRQESATFLQRSFSMLQCSFSFAAAQLLVQMTSVLQKRQFAVQFLQRSTPKTAVQLPFSLVACCRGGV